MTDVMEKLYHKYVERMYPCDNERFEYYKELHEEKMGKLKETLSQEDYLQVFGVVDPLYSMSIFENQHSFTVGFFIGCKVNEELRKLIGDSLE